MTTPDATSVFWVNILERDVWLLVNVNDRKLGIIITIPLAGREYLKVAGFDLGEITYIGERRNILSIKVERISESQQKEMLPKIQKALPADLREMPIVFL